MTLEEFCTNCGNFVNELDEYSGWCLPCSGKPEKSTQPAYYARWIEINADAIEEKISMGLSLTAAIKELRKEFRPKCLVCGEEIKGGVRGRAHFCTSTPACNSARRRYRTLREGAANLIPAIALEQVVREIT